MVWPELSLALAAPTTTVLRVVFRLLTARALIPMIVLPVRVSTTDSTILIEQEPDPAEHDTDTFMLWPLTVTERTVARLGPVEPVGLGPDDGAASTDEGRPKLVPCVRSPE